MVNIGILKDTVVSYRSVNGRMYAENRVASLRIDELHLLDSSRLLEIKSLTKSLKRVKSDTRIRLVHDTISVMVPVEFDGYFNYEDSCLWLAGVRDSSSLSLSYMIKPQEISITQYKRGNEIIAAASINGCGVVTSMSSITIEQEQKKWHDRTIAKVGFLGLLILSILF